MSKEPMRKGKDHLPRALMAAARSASDAEHNARGLLDALPVAIYTTDRDGIVTFSNKAARELAGREIRPGKDRWCVTHRLYWPDGTPLPHEHGPMAVALKEDRPVRGAEAIAERPDGSFVPILPYPTPLHDEQGRLIGGLNMLVDISERKRAEEQRLSLVDELNHRVNNVLAIVQAVAAQSIRADGIPMKEMRKALDARIVALGRMHYRISHARWGALDLDRICRDVLKAVPFEQIEFEGPPLRLGPSQSLTLGLVLHELATNAARFGALSVPEGRVALVWSRHGGRLWLSWREENGPDVAEPRYCGFGGRFIARSIAEMGGSARLRFDPAGVECDIELPMNREVDVSPQWLGIRSAVAAEHSC